MKIDQTTYSSIMKNRKLKQFVRILEIGKEKISLFATFPYDHSDVKLRWVLKLSTYPNLKKGE